MNKDQRYKLVRHLQTDLHAIWHTIELTREPGKRFHPSAIIVEHPNIEVHVILHCLELFHMEGLLGVELVGGVDGSLYTLPDNPVAIAAGG